MRFLFRCARLVRPLWDVPRGLGTFLCGLGRASGRVHPTGVGARHRSGPPRLVRFRRIRRHRRRRARRSGRSSRRRCHASPRAPERCHEKEMQACERRALRIIRQVNSGNGSALRQVRDTLRSQFGRHQQPFVEVRRAPGCDEWVRLPNYGRGAPTPRWDGVGAIGMDVDVVRGICQTCGAGLARAAGRAAETTS